MIPDPGEGLLVDLCCGEGLLSRALLERFPQARVLGHGPLARDAGARARQPARSTARPLHGTAVRSRGHRSWRSFPEPVRAFVSSLAIHHLDGEGKRSSSATSRRRWRRAGAVVIADLVEPATPGRPRPRRAGLGRGRAPPLPRARRRPRPVREVRPPSDWNLYADPEPDPIDQPSPLLDQLRWLEEAGLVGVDVYWLKAGHAVFGGHRRGMANRFRCRSWFRNCITEQAVRGAVFAPGGFRFHRPPCPRRRLAARRPPARLCGSIRDTPSRPLKSALRAPS